MFISVLFNHNDYVITVGTPEAASNISKVLEEYNIVSSDRSKPIFELENDKLCSNPNVETTLDLKTLEKMLNSISDHLKHTYITADIYKGGSSRGTVLKYSGGTLKEKKDY